jgi:hypothetical protein
MKYIEYRALARSMRWATVVRLDVREVLQGFPGSQEDDGKILSSFEE